MKRSEGVDRAHDGGKGAGRLTFPSGRIICRHWGRIEEYECGTRGGGFSHRLLPNYGLGMEEGLVGGAGGKENLSMRLIALFLWGCMAVSWAGDEIFPVRLGKKFGYVDQRGAVVVEAKYDWAWPLTEGRAGVREGRNWYLLGENFARIGQLRYDWIGPFIGGLAPAREGKLWGFIDRKGEWVIKPYFSDVRPFRGGVAAVQLGGQPGLVDKTDFFEKVKGVDLAPPVGDRMAPAAMGGKWGLVDERGNFLFEPKFDALGDRSEDLIPAKAGSAWGYVDAKGDWKISPQFLRAKNFDQGWAKVSAANGKDGWVNWEGKFRVRPPTQLGEMETAAGN